MYKQKSITESAKKQLLFQCDWLIENTVRFEELIIAKHAHLHAPEGKFLTLSVNGIGMPIVPGTYLGDVVIYVTTGHATVPGGLMGINNISRELNSAAVIENGHVAAEKCIPGMLGGGTITDSCADGLYIASSEDSFNGIVIDNSDYTVKNSRFDLEGFSDNDFNGTGAGVAVAGKSKVLIEDCEFNFSGVTRCTVHAGGNSEITVRNCRMINLSPDTDWLGGFSWQVGFAGSNRLTQLADNAIVTYDNCTMLTNGWGVCSLDGVMDFASLTVKNSRLELTGPRAHGYGAFCIGGNEVIFQDSTVDVNGYPMLLMGMEGKGRAAIERCTIRGRRFGAMVMGDDNSIFNISDSDFTTGKSSLVIKGSSTVINIKNTSMHPGNGTIVQLMDNDEGGMNMLEFNVPQEEDVPVAGLDLFSASQTEDVIMNLTGCRWEGNIYNSTTSLRAAEKCPRGGMGYFHDTLVGLVDVFEIENEDPRIGEVKERHQGVDMRGAKNLGLNLDGSSITGVISSAAQKYRDGLTRITEDNRLELSNITQTAAPTVNNGVIVSLKNGSRWIVADTSYITAISLDADSAVTAPQGKTLTVTIDGAAASLVSGGSYRGMIKLEVKE